MKRKVNQSMPLLPCRFLLRMSVAAACSILCAVPSVAQSIADHSAYQSEVALTYTAQHSLKAATNQSFWMQGGAAELGVPIFRGFGAALNVTGSHTGSVGINGAPLNLITFTAGPRYRFNAGSRLSIYGEALVGVARGLQSQFPVAGQLMPNTRASSFALQTGGGIDYALSRSFAVRAVNVAYVRTQLPNGTNNVQNTLQLGAGLVVRFGSAR